jgi:hypothetical protein
MIGRMSTTADVKPFRKAGLFHPLQVPHLQEAAEAAQVNLQRAVDFVILHEAYTVSGPSPAATLNEPTVLVAAAAWERFTGDLNAITHGKQWRGPGRHPSTVKGSNLIRPRDNEKEPAGPDETLPGDAARVLASMLGAAGPLDRFRVHLVYDWRGATPRFTQATGIGLRHKDYRRPAWPDEPWEHLTIGEMVYQAIKLRHAIAHNCLPRMGDDPGTGRDGSPPSPEDTHWLNSPSQLFWLSDKNDGLSVQAGCARGVLALFIQLIDQCIVALAGTLTDSRDQAAVLGCRLPQEWFGTAYPKESRRGLDWDVQLWRGNELMRLDIDDFWQ